MSTPNEESKSKWSQLDEWTKSVRRNQGKASRLSIRLAVLKAYAGGTPVCACCAEQRIEFLAIDHIEGGGKKERDATRTGGLGFYRLLRAKGFPPGYQVLCHNCNLAKGFYGRCPHQAAA